MDEKNFTPATASEKFLKHMKCWMENSNIIPNAIWIKHEEEDNDHEDVSNNKFVLAKLFRSIPDDDNKIIYYNEEYDWEYFVHVNSVRFEKVAYTAQQVFDAMPEWFKEMALDHISAMGYIRHLEVKERATTYGRFRNIVWENHKSWLSIFYSVMEYLLEKGLT